MNKMYNWKLYIFYVVVKLFLYTTAGCLLHTILSKTVLMMCKFCCKILDI